MRSHVSGLVLSMMLSGSLALAQTSRSPAIRRLQSRQRPISPGKEYPQVNSEGRVRVRVVAPQAQSVLLDIGR